MGGWCMSQIGDTSRPLRYLEPDSYRITPVSSVQIVGHRPVMGTIIDDTNSR